MKILCSDEKRHFVIKNKLCLEGYQVYAYKDYMITYFYENESYDDIVDFLHGMNYDSDLEALEILILENMEVHRASDYKKVIIDKKITDINHIINICEHFNKDSDSDYLSIVKEFKKIRTIS
jgi:hypothetical protein